MLDPLGVDVENLLSFAEEPSDELRDRLLLAKRFTWTWAKTILGWAPVLKAATTPGYIDEAPALLSRVYAMQNSLSALLDAIPVGSVFPGKDAKAAYNAVSAEWAQLYRDLASSAAALDLPGPIDVAGGIVDGITQAPADLIKYTAEGVANALKTAVGGTIAALWPWLALVGAAGLIYVFRAPIGRALGKVAT